MPNKWSWLALGVGAYLAFALSAFPAATAYRWFSPAAVELAGIYGTLWSGGAAAGTAAGLAVQDIRWRVRPWPLFIGRVGARFEARLADGFISAVLTATPSRVQFSDLQGSTSFATLQSLLPLRGMRGQASAALSDLRLENGWPTSVVGELRLAQLEVRPFISSSSAQLLSLGDYTVTFEDSSGNGVAARFADSGGPLEVTGTLVVDAARAYTIDALIEPRAGAASELVEGLRIMTAEPDVEGRRRLTLSGSL